MTGRVVDRGRAFCQIWMAATLLPRREESGSGTKRSRRSVSRKAEVAKPDADVARRTLRTRSAGRAWRTAGIARRPLRADRPLWTGNARPRYRDRRGAMRLVVALAVVRRDDEPMVTAL